MIITRHLKTIKKLGITGCKDHFKTKFNKKKFAYLYKQKALSHSVFLNKNINLEKLKQKDFVSKILDNIKIEQDYTLKQANLACSNCFNLLGSGEICFKENQIPWQHDFKLKKEPTKKLLFYQDIKVATPENLNFDDYSFDIKVPWELSRFQHLYYLGQAYFINNKELYAKTFCNQVSDWIDKNPYLLGVNWVCPMEVGIRAINLIYGFYSFKDSPSIDNKFWQKLTNSLYNHAIYLQNNWENWGQTNNHYLSDLIGYLYLCFFFDDLKHFQKQKHKFIKKILHEFDKQILPDGTSYEGSTNYHKLVTEIFLHFYLLCQTDNISLPDSFIKKFKKMQDFIDDCTDSNGNFVQIGDNDSGYISLPRLWANDNQK